MSAGEIHGTWLLTELTLKASLLLTAALVASLLFRRAPAALRHTVWSLALLSVLLVPAARLVLPDWRVSVPPVALPAPMVEALGWQPTGAAGAGAFPLATSGAAVAASGSSSSAEAGAPAIESARPAPGAASARGASRRPWILRLWVLGAALLALRLLVGSFQVMSLRRRAAVMIDPAWLSLRDELARDLGVKSQVQLLRGQRGVMPMTWGVLRPVILLPGEAAEWPPARRRTVLAHELAHVQRRDALTQWIGHIALIVHWFNPLVWLATCRLGEERERACDDAVLTLGAEPVEYAQHLLDIVRALGTATGPAPVMSMARRSRLEGRLLAVLDRQVRRGPTGSGKTAVAAAIALCALLPLGAITPGVASAAESDAAAAAPPPLSAPAAGAALPETVGRPYTDRAVIQPTSLKARPATETSIEATDVFLTPDRARVAGGGTTARPPTAASPRPPGPGAAGAGETFTTGRTIHRPEDTGAFPGTPVVVRIKAQDVVFTPERDGIAAILAGGLLRVEMERTDDAATPGPGTRHLLVTPDQGDRLHYHYRVDGVSRPFDPDARAWLASIIQTDMR
jgi:beta-lactamase regulating signal transducer with metallopeptidase domain